MFDRPIDLGRARILLTNDERHRGAGPEGPAQGSCGACAATCLDRGARESSRAAPAHSLDAASARCACASSGPRRFAVERHADRLRACLALKRLPRRQAAERWWSPASTAGANLGDDRDLFRHRRGRDGRRRSWACPRSRFSMTFTDRKKIRWPTAERHAPEVIRRLVAQPWPKNTTDQTSIFPDLPPSERQGHHRRAAGPAQDRRPSSWSAPIRGAGPIIGSARLRETWRRRRGHGYHGGHGGVDSRPDADPARPHERAPRSPALRKVFSVNSGARDQERCGSSWSWRAFGITDARVLGAIERVPREAFLSRHVSRPRLRECRAARSDTVQTISQPLVVAHMTEALDVGPRHKVASRSAPAPGYQAAVLREAFCRARLHHRAVSRSA